MKAVEAARERLAARHAGKIRRALRATINVEKLVRDWESSHPVEGTTPAQARAWVKVHAIPADKELNNALRYAYADAWVLGDRSASALLSHLKKKNKAEMPQLTSINWDNWKPGERAAAALLNPPNGLQSLLASRMVVIKDINNTTYDRLGTRLSDALSNGLTNEQTAALLDQVMNDPSRSLMIARTETARASSVAARNLYETSGVEYVEWLVAEGCDDCKENEDASPIPIDATFPSGDAEPPAHPNCMCALAPYVVDTQNIGGDNLDSSFTPDATLWDNVTPDENGMLDYGALADAQLAAAQKPKAELAWKLGKDLSPEDAAKWIAGKDKEAYHQWTVANIDPKPLKEGFQPIGSIHLTFDEGEAALHYARTGHDEMNFLLRNPKKIQWSPATIKSVDRFIVNLDSAISKGTPTPKDMITYRGMNKDAAELVANLNPGAEFSDAGFVSTSFKEEIAQSFAEDGALDITPKLILEILNPEGTIGLDMNGLQLATHTTEKEWLLPRDSKFRVISKSLPDKSNTVYMKVMVIK